MSKYFTKKERQEHLEKWRKGGLSKNAYALKAGLNPRTFIGWTWLKPAEKDTDFVEIPEKAFGCFSGDIVIEKGNIRVRLPISIGKGELQTVITALGALG